MTTQKQSQTQSALYTGRVTHQRLRPARHRLAYRVFSLLVDLDELPALTRRLRLFSLNRFNLYSLHERDYGCGETQSLAQYVRGQLRQAGLDDDGAIRLLTMPRILGYAFNPLSVYYCDDSRGRLQAILYEVNNTFGDRHSYLIEVPEAQRDGGLVKQQCSKQLYVSPFLDNDMVYKFRVEPPRTDHPAVSLGIVACDAQGPMLDAQLVAERRPLSDAELGKAFFTHPLLTLKVVVGIHWEALRLLLKRVPLRTRIPAPSLPVTFVKTIEP